MASAVEVIPGWERINERLDCTLVQLNRLIHHYADEPLEGQKDTDQIERELGCQSEECLESNIQDILKEAQKTLKEFTKSMDFTNLNFDNRSGRLSREANEFCSKEVLGHLELRIRHANFKQRMNTNIFQAHKNESEKNLAEAKRQISFQNEELTRVQHEVVNLHQRVREHEDTIDRFREEGVPSIKMSRELERTKADLIEKAKDLDNTLALKEKVEKELREYKRTMQIELGKEKMRRQRESIELKENFQNEILITTQQHVDREIELQDLCQREKDAHSKTIEDMMMLHKEEVKKLKIEHAIKLEECCQNHVSLESEWQDKEFELHKQISGAIQEKSHYIQLLFDENLKVQALEVQLARVQSDLANEKLAKSQVESELKFTKVDVTLANEKVKMGLKAHKHTQSIVASVQDEMMNMKRNSVADLAKLEEKAFNLQKNLSCVTNTCVQNEHELHTQSRKLDELQQCVNTKQKDLFATTSELQNLQQEVQSLRGDIKAKDDERKGLQKSYEAQCQQLQTTIFKLQMEEKQKCEDQVLKTKERLETQLQRQAHQHKKIVQKLQQQFRTQWEEHTRNLAFNTWRGMEGLCKS